MGLGFSLSTASIYRVVVAVVVLAVLTLIVLMDWNRSHSSCRTGILENQGQQKKYNFSKVRATKRKIATRLEPFRSWHVRRL